MTVKTAAIPPKVQLKSLLEKIVPNPDLHTRWLNTLSYMEHIGATKIARTQSGQNADFEVLKHTVEEARHAFYLKKLLRKIDPKACPTYEDAFLLAPRESRQYLYRLDIEISRFLREAGYEGRDFKHLAYLLTTFAIEVRADDLYPVYQEFLDTYPIKLSVRTIINEEEGHLEEMERALSPFPEKAQWCEKALGIESRLFQEWVGALEAQIL